MNDFTMYMVTHKPVEYIPAERTPIFVGSGDNKQGYIADCSGDNISALNKYYCELTALYWIWKNDNKSSWVSVEHYRRFFMNKHSLLPKIYKASDIEEILSKYDIITSRYFVFEMSIYDYYKRNHYAEDLDAVQRAINALHPEYNEAYMEVMNGHKVSMLNMMALSKERFDDYCSWLFDILFMSAQEIDLNGRDDYQQRAFGFMSERLLDVWIRYNSLRAYRVPIYHYQGNSIKSILTSVKRRNSPLRLRLKYLAGGR